MTVKVNIILFVSVTLNLLTFYVTVTYPGIYMSPPSLPLTNFLSSLPLNPHSVHHSLCLHSSPTTRALWG